MRIRRRRRVIFASRHENADTGIVFSHRPRELKMTDSPIDYVHIPAIFSNYPTLKDPVTTPTSVAQAETVKECLPLLTAAYDASQNPLDFNEHGVQRLNRGDHVQFLRYALDRFPSSFVGIDSSRPWMVYWALMGLYLLGEDVTTYREKHVLSENSIQCS